MFRIFCKIAYEENFRSWPIVALDQPPLRVRFLLRCGMYRCAVPRWSLPPSRLSFRFLLRCDSSELPKSCHLAQGSADVVLTRVNQLGTVKTLGQDVDEEASFAHVD